MYKSGIVKLAPEVEIAYKGSYHIEEDNLGKCSFFTPLDLKLSKGKLEEFIEIIDSAKGKGLEYIEELIIKQIEEDL